MIFHIYVAIRIQSVTKSVFFSNWPGLLRLFTPSNKNLRSVGLNFWQRNFTSCNFFKNNYNNTKYIAKNVSAYFFKVPVKCPVKDCGSIVLQDKMKRNELILQLISKLLMSFFHLNLTVRKL